MNQLNGYDVEDLRVGMSASFSKTITEADLVLFAGVSDDNKAMHVNEEISAVTAFGRRIAHGMLTSSAISATIANKMPGPGTIYLRQNLRFRAPVRPGETVHATVTLTEIVVGRRRVTAGHSVVITGSAHRRTSHRHTGGTGLAEWTPAQAEAVHNEFASHLIKMTARYERQGGRSWPRHSR